ncbi:MAG: hypothetical protein KGL41_06220 [Actinomycetales bacterium]|nr:hypothetical protein [Actinomycetales bacterium]
MKLNGSRLMLWSLIAIFVSSIGNFTNLGTSPIGNFVTSVVESLGSLAWLGLIAGGIWNFIERKNQPDTAAPSSTKFWIGLVMVGIGLAIPAWCFYEMFFVPGGADAIFLLMIFGPFGLALIIGGALTMSRNRKAL